MNLDSLKKFIDEHYKQRMLLLVLIEEVRNHHLVKEHVDFSIKDGEITYSFNLNGLNSSEEKQVRARVNKIRQLIYACNVDYKNMIKQVGHLPKKEKEFYLKECASHTIKQYDGINDYLVKLLKSKNKLPEDFNGEVDLNILADNPVVRKHTLILLKQYEDYELNLLTHAEKLAEEDKNVEIQ